MKVCSHIDPAHPFYLFEFEQNVRNTAKLYIQNIQAGEKTKRDFHYLKHLIGNEKDCKASSGH